MTGLDRPLRVFFSVGNMFHIVPCRYNSETNRFEANSRQNLLAFAINLTLCGSLVCYDWLRMSEGKLTLQSPTSNIIIMIYLVTFPPSMVYMQLQTYANRKRITALFNVLFLDECWWSFVPPDNRLGLFACAFLVGVMVCLGGLVTSLSRLNLLLDAIVDMAWFYVAAFMTVVYVVCVLMLRIRLVQLQDAVQRNPLAVRSRWIVLLDQCRCSVRLVEEINRNFSGIMLTIIIQMQLELSNQYFTLYCYVQHGITLNEALWVTQCWASQFLVMLLAVGLSCERCHNQLDETIVAIRNSFDWKEDDDDDDHEYRPVLMPRSLMKHMDKFLLDNLEQKMRFNACGFFDMDSKLICMVLISIVTYLLVLIQFHQREIK
uniref:Gustatory receptor n=1 Tax=Anopheles atroparvus TaxID=41427 RepID=A0A182JC73_ANOAO